MSLKEVYCQDKAISVLQHAFAGGRLAHACIFAGAEGVGKLKTAREWAKLLLCADVIRREQFADSCGRCQSCRLLEAGSHPDFHLVYKELREFTAAGRGKPAPINLPIDVIREFLIDKVPTRPSLSSRKVFVVREAQKLNAASQNALLKVLEEPPEYCCIILLCTRLQQLLPTIKSRCQIIRFGPVAEEKIIEKLEQMGLPCVQAAYFARLAQGSLGLACQWGRLESSGAELYRIKTGIVEGLSTSRYADALDLAEQFLTEAKKIAAIWSKMGKNTSKTDLNRRGLKTILLILVSVLYDTMKIGAAGQSKIINSDQLKVIEALAEKWEPEQAAQKIATAHQAMRRIDASVNEKLIFEQLLLNLTDSDRIIPT